MTCNEDCCAIPYERKTAKQSEDNCLATWTTTTVVMAMIRPHWNWLTLTRLKSGENYPWGISVQYRRECSVLWRDYISTLGNTISAVEDIQYGAGKPQVLQVSTQYSTCGFLPLFLIPWRNYENFSEVNSAKKMARYSKKHCPFLCMNEDLNSRWSEQWFANEVTLGTFIRDSYSLLLNTSISWLWVTRDFCLLYNLARSRNFL